MGTALMARRNRQNTRGAAIAQAIMAEYQPQTREEMQDAIKEIFGPMFEAMLQGEMDSHLGYGNNKRGEKNTTNRRNGYSHKSVNTAYGKMDVSVPRDREESFEPKAIPKRTKDISRIADKVLSMYARGMSQRGIADTVEDITPAVKYRRFYLLKFPSAALCPIKRGRPSSIVVALATTHSSALQMKIYSA